MDELTLFERNMAHQLSYLLKNDEIGYETAVFINGCEQYGVEDDMMAYAQKHPQASLRELWAYFHSIAPPLEYTDEEYDNDEDGE